jgi:aminopeptidase N
MEHKALHALRPEFDVWTRFAKSVKEAAMEVDSGPRSHSIAQSVIHPKEIEDKFDMISYCKGASVLRMCESLVGEEAFKLGVQDYLNEHLYQNTTTQDLWRAIHKHSAHDPAVMMHDWTLKAGFPSVKVRRSAEGHLQLSQSKFRSTVSKPETWLIPIQYQDSEGRVNLFSFSSLKAVLELPAGSKMPKLNYHARGFYKVFYEGDLLVEVFERYASYSVEDRYELIYDLCLFYSVGLVSMHQFLAASAYVQGELNYVILTRIDQFLRWLWVKTDGENEFRSSVQNLTRQFMSRSWECLRGSNQGEPLRALRLCAEILAEICGDQAIKDFLEEDDEEEDDEDDEEEDDEDDEEEDDEEEEEDDKDEDDE